MEPTRNKEEEVAPRTGRGVQAEICRSGLNWGKLERTTNKVKWKTFVNDLCFLEEENVLTLFYFLIQKISAKHLSLSGPSWIFRAHISHYVYENLTTGHVLAITNSAGKCQQEK